MDGFVGFQGAVGRRRIVGLAALFVVWACAEDTGPLRDEGLLREHGTLPLAEVTALAIELAEEGFRLMPGEAARHAAGVDRLDEFDGSRVHFLTPSGESRAARLYGMDAEGLAAVAGCETRSPAGGGAEPGDVGKRVMEAIAAGLVEDLSELRILAGSWNHMRDPDLAAEIKAYAEASGTSIACPGGDPHCCWTDGRPWKEVHGDSPRSPRTMPQVIRFWALNEAVTFHYRYRQDDGTLQDLAPLYGMDVERLETGEWRIGELKHWGGWYTW